MTSLRDHEVLEENQKLLVRKLREDTGLGILCCLEALKENNWNIEVAKIKLINGEYRWDGVLR
jgi:hypothetical protein